MFVARTWLNYCLILLNIGFHLFIHNPTSLCHLESFFATIFILIHFNQLLTQVSSSCYFLTIISLSLFYWRTILIMWHRILALICIFLMSRYLSIFELFFFSLSSTDYSLLWIAWNMSVYFDQRLKALIYFNLITFIIFIITFLISGSHVWYFVFWSITF